MRVGIRARREESSGPSRDRWLLPYAGLLMLLFALFVVMYALSNADPAKVREASRSIRDAIEGKAPPSGPGFPGDGVRSQGSLEATGTPSSGSPSAEGSEAPSLRSEVSRQLDHAGVSDQVIVDEDSRGVIVKLAASDFFAPGDAAVRPDMRPLLDRICKVLAGFEHRIRVEGHADASEKLTPVYPSGWELAAARATGVVRHLIQRHGMDPSRLSAVSFGHTRPWSGESGEGASLQGVQTELSRAKNRRVEFVVINVVGAASAQGDGL